MADRDQVVFSTIRQRFECTVCGGYLLVSFPCGVDFLANVGRAFTDEHRRCRPAPREAEVLDVKVVETVVLPPVEAGCITTFGDSQ